LLRAIVYELFPIIDFCGPAIGLCLDSPFGSLGSGIRIDRRLVIEFGRLPSIIPFTDQSLSILDNPRGGSEEDGPYCDDHEQRPQAELERGFHRRIIPDRGQPEQEKRRDTKAGESGSPLANASGGRDSQLPRLPRPDAGGQILGGSWPSLPEPIRRAMLALISYLKRGTITWSG
jgi:hypothetical protein